MDIKLLLTTFGLVFLAELGDKTQLATFCFSADCDSKLSVFLGSAGALVLSSLIAVVFWRGRQPRGATQLYQDWRRHIFRGGGGLDTLCGDACLTRCCITHIACMAHGAWRME